MRESVGVRHFTAQMMLDFIPPSRIRLDPGGLVFYDNEFDAHTARIGDVRVTGCTLYWDPSTGRRNRDSSACVLLYRDDSSQHLYLHDILYLTVCDDEAYPLSRQCDAVLDFMQSRFLNRITIETNGIGGGLPEILRTCATSRGMRIVVTPIQNSKPKSDRILSAIEPALSTGRLHSHIRIQHTPLLSEMLGWSPIGGGGIHDDGLDALAGAITNIPTPVRPDGGTVQIRTANTNFQI